MHEASIVTIIFRIVREKMDALYGVQLPVKKIRVVAGKMSNVVPEALDFAFELVGAGTPFEGVEREIEYVPLKVLCNDCRREMILDEPFMFCRHCDSFNLTVLTGNELYVDSFEVDDGSLINTKKPVGRPTDGNKSRRENPVEKR